MSVEKIFCLLFKSKYWLDCTNIYQMCGMDRHKGFYLRPSPHCWSWTFPWSLMRFLRNFSPLVFFPPILLKTEICLVEWTVQVQKTETRTRKNLLKLPILTQHQCWLKRKISTIENEDIIWTGTHNFEKWKTKNYQVLFPILLWNLMWSPALTKWERLALGRCMLEISSKYR